MRGREPSSTKLKAKGEKMTDGLDTKTDAQLSEIFATEVAGWTFTLGTVEKWWRDGDGHFRGAGFINLPHFATSADAVLPWLEKANHLLSCWDGKLWCVAFYFEGNSRHSTGTQTTFARAACIAIIRATRARKGAQSA